MDFVKQKIDLHKSLVWYNCKFYYSEEENLMPPNTQPMLWKPLFLKAICMCMQKIKAILLLM